MSNARLKQALLHLQLAQDELVRREKLVSLGSLVAGVAHELNTPLGNSLTAATALADKTREFVSRVAAGSLRRSTLNVYTEVVTEAATLLTRNLWRASELITDLKQVAVDQTSAQRRGFDLAEVVHEVVATLQPKFKRTRHRVDTDIAQGVLLDSFPGPLGQIITNLVTNAMIHGLGDMDGGVVRLAARRAGTDQVCLTVQDNGRGIPAKDLPRIFDPFFTTRMGQGGSGLGLHIVYSIATRILGGQIEVDSQPGTGTVFTLTIPLAAPVAGDEPGHWGAVDAAELETRDPGPPRHIDSAIGQRGP